MSARPAADDDIVATHAEAAGNARPPLLVTEPLEAFLDARGLGAGPLTATPVGEGHSNVTFVIARGGWEAILRRPPRPPVPPSAHDMLREARVLGGLEGRARVPRVLAVCDDEAVIGVPFYVMEKLEGHVVTSALPDVLDDPGSAARSRTSSSTRWWRSTPSTGGRPASPGSASRTATSSARSAASAASGT